MSHDDESRIVTAARRLREREGPHFPVSALAKPAGVSRATLYRRLAACPELRAQVERIRTEGGLSPREELLRAAAELLADKGLAGLTMEAIAARAGLSVATLYRCFSDRDGLVREVIKGSLSGEAMRRTLDDQGSLEEVLLRLVEAAMERIRDKPHIVRFMLFGAEEDVRALRRLRRDEERVSIALAAFFERPENRTRLRPISPKKLVALLMGQVVGAAILARTHEDTGTIDARTLVQLFLHGVLAGGQAPPSQRGPSSRARSSTSAKRAAPRRTTPRSAA